MIPTEQIDDKVFERWNLIGLRAAYGQMLLQMVKTDDLIIAVSADLGRSSGLDRFLAEYPGNYVAAGIAEQNMVGMSAGMAHAGFRVFASSFAPFISFRAAEQVRLGLGYMASPVNLVGMASGFSLGFLGATHYGLEDLAVMRSIPGIEIFQPSDARELWTTLNYVSTSERPSYIRLTGSGGLGSLSNHEHLQRFPDGSWLAAPEGQVVVTSGVTSHIVARAINELTTKRSQSFGHYHTPVVRPFPRSFLSRLSAPVKMIVIEEHSIIGGLGDELRHFLTSNGQESIELRVHGIAPGFPHGNSYGAQLKEHLLDEEGVIGFLGNM